MALSVLTALDAATLQYYHYKAIVIAGMGLFTDAFNLFCLPLVMILLGRVYYPHKSYNAPVVVSSLLAASTLLGTVFGQLIFGWLGDRQGRRRVYMISLLTMVFSAFACGFSMGKSRACVLATLGVFRFTLGVGIGGDYPLSATIMSEFANKRTRGQFIAAVFSMQGFGILFSGIVTIVVCALFNFASHKASEDTKLLMTDMAWRIIVMLGAIPAALTCYLRSRMPETARYTALVEQNEQQAAREMKQVLDVELEPIPQEPAEVPQSLSLPSYPFFSKTFIRLHGHNLFGCACTWMLVDVVFYTLNLFQNQIYGHPSHSTDANTAKVFKEVIRVAALQALIALYSTLPGYFAAVFFIERMGRVKMQIIGFFFMAIGSFALGIPYKSYKDKDSNKGFMALFGFTLFFANFGPNTTTFIVPAELFPARFRTTCHGISGAFGKLGALIGLLVFSVVSPDNYSSQDEDSKSLKKVFEMWGCVCLIGMVITYFFTPETRGRSLEDNETENVGGLKMRRFLTCLRSSSSARTDSSLAFTAAEPAADV
ncbi:Major facilitator, sugar transporter-like [Dillenia turbinata]|uniref:Major facilitator, sugar transporter-like n=1 Tax=Dillenia turbinata TaxID=194707 RepID=A0AAN8ZFL2_9MAGN